MIIKYCYCSSYYCYYNTFTFSSLFHYNFILHSFILSIFFPKQGAIKKNCYLINARHDYKLKQQLHNNKSILNTHCLFHEWANTTDWKNSNSNTSERGMMIWEVDERSEGKDLKYYCTRALNHHLSTKAFALHIWTRERSKMYKTHILLIAFTYLQGSSHHTNISKCLYI